MTTAREERPAAVQRRAPAAVARSDDGARAAVTGALSSARSRMEATPGAVLALQRQAGNAAVGALLAAKAKLPGGQAATDLDGALREMKRDEPAVEPVEKGLKAAKDVGVPVDLEGPKPPPSALAVTKTGFGPGAVAPKKPVPPPKPVPATSPLGKAAAKKSKPAGPAKGGPKGGGAAPASPSSSTAAPAPAPLSADKLLEPPAPPTHQRPEEDPAFTAVTAKVGGFAKAKKAHPPAAAKAAEAQGAAQAPPDDLAGQAQCIDHVLHRITPYGFGCGAAVCRCCVP